MACFIPGSAEVEPTSEVELTLSCRDLVDSDLFTKSDPMVVVYLKTYETLDWQEIFRTEVIDNNLNPEFARKVHLTYRFEEKQKLKFEVYDIDNNSPSLERQDFLGRCETTLGEIVSNGKVELPLSGTKCYNKGVLIAIAEELSECKDEVTLQFVGRVLYMNYSFWSWFCLSSPFLELHKIYDDFEYRVVYRSEVIKWTSNPHWKPFAIPVRSLCGGEMDRSIKIACYDWNAFGNHTFIGECIVTLKDLSRGPGSHNTYHLLNPHKEGTMGQINLVKYKFTKVYSFLDYILGGTQLNCTIAIDFTSSNGDPQSPMSLHFTRSAIPNQYEQALSAVGEIIQDYDSDKMFPVLGFGARVPPEGRVSHEFYVNMNPTSPFCSGIQGVLEAYRFCINQIQLSGPTNFSPVIDHVAKFAAAHQDGSQYFILLIITDGIISDMGRTKKAIIQASELPMSIIIVGVGNADFTAMDELDGDTIPVTYNNKCAKRDIVQFVPFRNFQSFHNIGAAKAYLAKEVLAELPDQIVSYMKSRNIVPKPRSPAHQASAPPPPPSSFQV